MLRLPRAAAQFAAAVFVTSFVSATPVFADTAKIDAADTHE
jgi:hypothetical protein